MSALNIYLAGKISNRDWRSGLVVNGEIFGQHRYVGPFFDHRVSDHATDHKGALESDNAQRAAVKARCLNSIAVADVVFAWLPANERDLMAPPDCFGTIYELGYATALLKPVCIASNDDLPRDLWFAWTNAQIVTADDPATALKRFLAPMAPLNDNASPIERKFFEMWHVMGNQRPLVPQHPIGRYFVDFAHIETRTAVELDGFDHHSSTVDIENDRKRQRAIEDLGWHVIRFGGREIHRAAEECVRAVMLRIESREAAGESEQKKLERAICREAGVPFDRYEANILCRDELERMTAAAKAIEARGHL